MADDIYDRVARLERKVDGLVRAVKKWTEMQLAERERERFAERRRRATRRPKRKK